MKSETRYHLVLNSNAHKLEGLSVYRTPSNTCPDTCPLKGKGCYDELGNCLIHRRNHDQGKYNALTVSDMVLNAIKQTTPIIRACIGGDLAGQGNHIDWQENCVLFAGFERENRTVILFTHKPILWGSTSKQRQANLSAIRKVQAVAPSLAVNLSCETFEQVDLAIASGLDAAVVIPSAAQNVLTTPDNNRVVVCPEVQGKASGCKECGGGRPLCSRKNRGYAVAFPVHGGMKNSVLQILK